MTPYHHKARVKGVGCDCGSFIYSVYCGFLELKPYPTEYPEDWTLHAGGEELYLDFIGQYVKQVPYPVPAGLALFQVGRRYGHGAICLEDGKFIHAWGATKHGCVRISPLWFFKNPKSNRPYPVKFFDVV